MNLDDLKARYTGQPDSTSPSSNGLDVVAYLEHYGRKVLGAKPNGDGTFYLLDECVFDSNHRKGQASIGKTYGGKLFYKCFHDSCQGRTWAEAREIISGKDKLDRFMSGNGAHGHQSGPEESVTTVTPPPFNPLDVMKTGQALQEEKDTTTWIWDKILAEKSITLLYGKGGGSKTWLTLGAADHISRGEPYFGMSTKRVPVYYMDFENPYPMLCDRSRFLDIKDVLFWHQSYSPPPPKIDSKDFEQYKQLPPGLIIFDTLRSAQDGDENDSKVMSMVMGRLKELRDLGFTILPLHHTPKANERKYKGSTAIIDLCDQALAIYQVKAGSLNEIVEDEDDTEEDKFFRFGTKDKTRYEPFHIYLRLDPAEGLVPVADPSEDTLDLMQAVLVGKGRINQSTFFEECKTDIGMKSKKRFINLLKRGDGKYWTTTREKKAVFYESL